MQTIPQEQVLKRFNLLPQTLKDAIFSRKTIDAILKYCALREIPEDDTHIVGTLTSDVLLGYLRPESFASEIQKETGVEELKAQHVAHDLDMEIFSEVRLELKKLYPPSMQTPTVQARGFAALPPQATSYQLPAKPKYVIQIPEKFMKRETWNVKREIQEPQAVVEKKSEPLPARSEPAPTPVAPTLTPATPTTPPPISEPTKQAPEVPKEIRPPSKVVPEKKEEVKIQQPQETKKQEASSVKIAQTVVPSGIKMSPVVPLPTFIGSRSQPKNESAPSKAAEKKPA